MVQISTFIEGVQKQDVADIATYIERTLELRERKVKKRKALNLKGEAIYVMKHLPFDQRRRLLYEVMKGVKAFELHHHSRLAKKPADCPVVREALTWSKRLKMPSPTEVYSELERRKLA